MNLTHIDEQGKARMVDVSGKPQSVRKARAVATVRMGEDTMRLLMAGELPKGEALAVARIAGIMGAKRTADLIPLCHPLRIQKANVEFSTVGPGLLEITSEVVAVDTTGVEMEALTAVTCAALTVIDMCKAVDKTLSIERAHILSKSGGQSDDFIWREEDAFCKEE